MRAIHISARKQTKWWYSNRFLHPDNVASYDYMTLRVRSLTSSTEKYWPKTNSHNCTNMSDTLRFFVEIMAPVFLALRVASDSGSLSLLDSAYDNVRSYLTNATIILE
ncbi:hypothetical protein SASPL_142621 [Salvia splendens]|uniref:Uncharacterized protein n=1 Tax=Salvia splendens TaxID=180675 RepID=A0A8X8WKM4_SALSN|nr:hypothetical protein SASPL_142621 [Salvia splendens]